MSNQSQSLPNRKSSSNTETDNSNFSLDKEVSSQTDSSSVEQSSSKKKTKSSVDSKQDKEERKRYKILAGNGCHQAIAEIEAILVPPTEKGKSFTLVLRDGLQIEATFKTPRLHWIALNKEYILGLHWFRGYPKMKDDKLVSLQIIAWDGNMPSNLRGEEHWEFIGVWTAQKNITVQRSMMTADIRKIAKETGFIKKFKYTFTNSLEWARNRKLWMGYVYKVLCTRKSDTLEIRRVIPYACPRIKPVPKTSNNKYDSKNQNKSTFKPSRKK